MICLALTLILLPLLLIPAYFFGGKQGIIVNLACIFSVVFLVWIYFRSTAFGRILKALDAKPIDRVNYRLLHERLEKIRGLIKVSVPRVYVYEDLEINTVTLRQKGGTAILISTGMLNSFELSELEVVLIHGLIKANKKALEVNTFVAALLLFVSAPLKGKRAVTGLFYLFYLAHLMPYYLLMTALDLNYNEFQTDNETNAVIGGTDPLLEILNRCRKTNLSGLTLTKLALSKLYFMQTHRGRGILFSDDSRIGLQNRVRNMIWSETK